MRRKYKGAFLIGTSIVLLSGCTNKQSAVGYYNKGIADMELGKIEEANEYFEKAVSTYQDTDYYIAYGMSFIELGEYDKAKVQFQDAFSEETEEEAFEKNKKAYRAMGILYYKMEEYEAAIEQFTNSLKITEKSELDEDITKYLIKSCIMAQKYDKAVEVSSSYLKNSELSEIYALRGDAYTKAQEYDKAEKDFQRAIELDESCFAYYFDLYNVYQLQGNEKKAKEILSNVLQIKVSSTEEYEFIAKAYMYMGEYDQAISTLEGIISNSTKAYYWMGEVYYQKGDYDKAMEQYTAYAKEATGDELQETYYQLAQCAFQKEEYEKSLAYCVEGLKVDSIVKKKELLCTQVAANEQLQQYEEAYKLATEYLKSYPGDEAMQKEATFLETR